MRLPDFIGIGAQKCGTTALHVYLREHPDLYLPRRKELNFFRDDGNWQRGLEWYARHFDRAAPGQRVGEISPQYARLPRSAEVPQRMHELLPQAKLIYLVRDPVDRLRSAWQQAVARGRESRPLAEALLADETYLSVTLYAQQLEAFAQHYPRESFLVLDAADLRHERVSALRNVFTHLGVDPSRYDYAQANEEIHLSRDKQRPSRMALLLANSRLGRGSKAFVPKPITRLGLQLASKPIAHEPSIIPDAVLERLLPAIRTDVRRLRDWMPDTFSGWGLA